MVSELRVGDVMTKKVIVCRLEDTLEQVSRTMKKYGIGSVIIVDDKAGKHARGIVTERDIVYKVVAQKKDPYKMKATDLMSKPLRVVMADSTLEEATRAMKSNKIKRLPVINDKKELIGIISETDIMRIFPAVVDLLEERIALK